MNCCIIKNKNDIISYYYADSKIFKSEFKNNNLNNEKIIATNTRKNFTVCYGSENIILFQLLNGDICIIDENQRPKIILKNTADMSPDVIINSILTDNLRLIYNITDKNNENNLITQIQGEDKIWSKPIKIDSSLLSDDTVKIVELGKNLHIVIYGKKMPEYQFGYREINNHKISDFKMIYSTGYKVMDYSYVITKDCLHFVFIQSTGFIQRIIYVKKDTSCVSSPKILFEGFGVKNCLAFIKHSKLYIFWISNRSMNYRCSYDFGNTFDRAQIKRGINTNNITKAVFVDKTVCVEDNYIFNEVYADKNHNALFLDEESI